MIRILFINFTTFRKVHMIESRSGLTSEEAQALKFELQRDGLREVENNQQLVPRQFKINSHSGNAQQFGELGELQSYTVEWCI